MAYKTSAQSGNWSATSTWTGGVVPGDGDFVLIQSDHQINLDQNVGTVGNGIKRIAINGHVGSPQSNLAGLYCTSPGAAYTIYFASTGTDPLGTGSVSNPAEDATMFGFWVPRGTLRLKGTLARPITVTSGDDTNPIYIRHNWSDGTAGSGVTQFGALDLQYCDIRHLGKNAVGYEGIYWDFRSSGTASIDHCKINDYWVAFTSSSAPSTTPVITWSTFSGRKGANTIYFAQQFTSGVGATIEDNTEISPTITGILAYFLMETSGGAAYSIKRNFIYSSSSTIRVTICRGAGGSAAGTWNVDDNICLNTPTTTGTVAAGWVASLNRGLVGSTFKRNIGEYCYMSLDFGNGTSTSGQGIEIADCFIRGGRDASPGQGNGAIIRAGTNSVTNCIAVIDTTSTYSGVPIAWFDYSINASFRTTTVFNHITVYATGVPQVIGILASEGSHETVNDQVRNCLISGAATGIMNGNSATTYAIDYAGVGVHHNCTHNCSTANYGYQGGATALQTAGWSDGTNTHPNAVYADLTTDPQFKDPTVSIGGWDASLGGAGTRANVATEFAKRSGFGGTYNSNYTTANMLAYLFAGFAPTNTAFLESASDGTAIGAVPVFVPVLPTSRGLVGGSLFSTVF